MGSLSRRTFLQASATLAATSAISSSYHANADNTGNAELHPFQVGIEMPSHIPVTSAVESALRDMGIDYLNYYVSNAPDFEPPESEVNAAMLDLCERLGVDFSIACHHRDPAPQSVQAAVEQGRERFRGVLFDELAHIRLMSPEFATVAEKDMLADPTSFDDLEQAYEATLAGYERLRHKFEELGAPRVTATHVWPELLHLASRAGFAPCPKIQKEFYSSVSLAIGLLDGSGPRVFRGRRV